MDKRFLISVVVALVLMMGLSYAIHGVLLHDDYVAMGSALRPPAEAERMMHFMALAQALTAIAFVWIYRRGREDRPFLGQGLRFGLAVIALSTAPMFLIYYVVQPIPGATVVKQIALESLMVLIVGVAVAWLNRRA